MSVQAHGVLMVVAWVFILPISVAIARTCKGCDPLWFQLHRALGVSPPEFLSNHEAAMAIMRTALTAVLCVNYIEL